MSGPPLLVGVVVGGGLALSLSVCQQGNGLCGACPHTLPLGSRVGLPTHTATREQGVGAYLGTTASSFSCASSAATSLTLCSAHVHTHAHAGDMLACRAASR